MGFGAKPYTLTKADIDAVLGYDVDLHAGRHASSQADVVTPAAIAAVAKTGAETIAGVKRFDAVPLVKTTSGLYVPVHTAGRGGPHWENSNWLPADMVDSAVGYLGSVTWYDNYVKLNTGTTISGYAYLRKECYGLREVHTWDKDRYFGAFVSFNSDADAFARVCCGRIQYYSQVENTTRHLGFQTEGDHLYASVGDNIAQTKVDLGSFSAAPDASLECYLVAGVRCEFYWNGVLLATITTNLPSGVNNADEVFRASIGTVAEADKEMRVYEVRFDQAE